MVKLKLLEEQMWYFGCLILVRSDKSGIISLLPDAFKNDFVE